ncbi:MAG TPA: HAD-IA family hydrolase [Actinomycetota bacterium]|nr:HAD-IA family hydrolase [Actinomycetota bacterium]
MTAIEALLFDFDGIVVDTEVPAFRAWQEVYAEHGHALALDEWAACVGTLGGFDPLARLEELVGRPLDDPEAVDARRRQRNLELVAAEELRPGLGALLDDARERDLDVAIVSSGSREWITSNLARVQRSDGWACFHCADGDAGRAKPRPLLYEEALASLGVAAHRAIAFEDSPNGIRAAKDAGLFCVVVPNAVTRGLDLSAGDLVLESFEDVTLDELLRLASRG